MTNLHDTVAAQLNQLPALTETQRRVAAAALARVEERNSETDKTDKAATAA